MRPLIDWSKESYHFISSHDSSDRGIGVEKAWLRMGS